MPTIQNFEFYFDSPGDNFPIVVPYEDVTGSRGITLTDGEIVVPQWDESSRRLRLVNYTNVSDPSSKMGSILAVCAVYDDGQRCWIDSIISKSPNSVNLNIAVGNWVSGKTYDEAVHSSGYQKPYIGYVNDYADFHIADYVPPPPPPDPTPPPAPNPEPNPTPEPPPPPPSPDPQPAPPPSGSISVTLSPSYATVHLGDSLTITATIVSDTPVVDYHWDINNQIDVNVQGQNKAVLQFNTLGTFRIGYTATNQAGQSASDACTVVVVNPPPKPTDVSLFVKTKDGAEIPVSSSIKLNNYNIDPTNIPLIFRNTGGSTWVGENFSVSIGQMVFQDGSNAVIDSLTKTAGGEYHLTGVINPFNPSSNYTIVIKAVVLDDQNHSETKFFEIRWMAQQGPDVKLNLIGRPNLNLKLPNRMKRNARYRGPRESEKYLSDHQEEIFEIRQNWKDIDNLTNLQQQTIQAWFHGETEAHSTNVTLSGSKTMQASVSQDTYELMSYDDEGTIENLVVELNGTTVDPKLITVNGLRFTIDRSALQDGSLSVSYVVTLSVPDQILYGLDALKLQLRELDERLGELERSCASYENAYK